MSQPTLTHAIQRLEQGGALSRLEKLARGMLRSFRVKYDFWSDAPEFNELVEELRSLSPAFWRW